MHPVLARLDDFDWIINGSKHFISAPVVADFAILFACTGMDDTPRGERKRVTAFLVDAGQPIAPTLGHSFGDCTMT